MATYPLILKPSFPYRDHLMYNQYIADINKGLARAASNLVESHILSSKAISSAIKNNSVFISDTITESTNLLSDNISNLNQTIEFGLNKVATGIAGLRSDFDIAMGKVLCQFEMMRHEFQDGIERIIHTLENPRKTDAREHFRDALEFYGNGCRFPDKPQWFRDALKHFLASIEQYESNPIAHLHIAHIFHYQAELQNFDRSLHHYQLCLTYGEANKKQYPIAAQGAFYAGWLFAAVHSDYQQAIEQTLRALELDPSLGEAHYNLAKYLSVFNKPTQAVKHLRQAVVNFDRNYCIKAAIEPDLITIQDHVNDLFICLRDDAQKNLKNFLSRIDREFSPKDSRLREQIENISSAIKSQITVGTYFSFLDALPLARKLMELVSYAKDAQEKRYEIALKKARDLEKFFKSHICPNEEQDRWARARLSEAKDLLTHEDFASHDEFSKFADHLFKKIQGKWISKEDFTALRHKEQIQKKAEKQAEQQQQKANELKRQKANELERRKANRLCLMCGQPIGLLQRLKKNVYCKVHSKKL